MAENCSVAIQEIIEFSKLAGSSALDTHKLIIDSIYESGNDKMLEEYSKVIQDTDSGITVDISELTDLITYFDDKTKALKKKQLAEGGGEDTVIEADGFGVDIDYAEFKKGEQAVKEAFDEIIGNSENTGSNYAEINEEDMEFTSDFMDSFNMLYFGNRTAFMEEFENEFNIQIRQSILGLVSENGVFEGPRLDITDKFHEMISKWKNSYEVYGSLSTDEIDQAFKQDTKQAKAIRLLFYEHLMYQYANSLLKIGFKGLSVTQDIDNEVYNVIKGKRGLKIHESYEEDFTSFVNANGEFLQVKYDALEDFLDVPVNLAPIGFVNEDEEYNETPIFIQLSGNVPADMTYNKFKGKFGIDIIDVDGVGTSLPFVRKGDVLMYDPSRKVFVKVSPKHVLRYNTSSKAKFGHEEEFSALNNDSEFIKTLLKTALKYRVRVSGVRGDVTLYQDPSESTLTDQEYYTINMEISKLKDKTPEGIRKFLINKINARGNSDVDILYRAFYYAFFHDRVFEYTNIRGKKVKAMSLYGFSELSPGNIDFNLRSAPSSSVAKSMLDGLIFSLSKMPSGRTFYENGKVKLFQTSGIEEISFTIPSHIYSRLFEQPAKLYNDVREKLSLTSVTSATGRSADRELKLDIKAYKSGEPLVTANIRVNNLKLDIKFGDFQAGKIDNSEYRSILLALQLDVPYTDMKFIKKMSDKDKITFLENIVSLIVFNSSYGQSVVNTNANTRRTFKTAIESTNENTLATIFRPSIDALGRVYKDVKGISSPSYYYTGNNNRAFKFVNIDREHKINKIYRREENDYFDILDSEETKFADPESSIYSHSILQDDPDMEFVDRYQKDGMKNGEVFIENKSMILKQRLIRAIEGSFISSLRYSRNNSFLVQPMVYSDRETIYEYMIKLNDVKLSGNIDGVISKFKKKYIEFYRKKYMNMQYNAIDNWLNFLIHEGSEYTDKPEDVRKIIAKYSKYSKKDMMNNNVVGEMIKDIAKLGIDHSALAKSKYLVRNLNYSKVKYNGKTIAVPPAIGGMMSEYLGDDARATEWVNGNIETTTNTIQKEIGYDSFSSGKAVNDAKKVFGNTTFKNILTFHYLVSSMVQESALDTLISFETEFSANSKYVEHALKGKSYNDLSEKERRELAKIKSANYLKESKRVQPAGSRGLEPAIVRGYGEYHAALPYYDLAKGELDARFDRVKKYRKLDDRFYSAFTAGIFTKIEDSFVSADGEVLLTYAGYAIKAKIVNKKLVIMDNLKEVFKSNITTEELAEFDVFINNLNSVNWRIPGELSDVGKDNDFAQKFNKIIDRRRNVEVVNEIKHNLNNDEGEYGIEMGSHSKNILIDEDFMGGPTTILGKLGMKQYMSQDTHDGVQWGHPLYFLRLTAGTGVDFSSFGSDGSAVKALIQTKNPRTGEILMQKMSTQNIFSNEILLKHGNDQLYNLFRIMNERIEFPDIDIKIPVEGGFEYKRFKNMQELWEHFGSYYNNDSWTEVAKVLAINPRVRDSYVEKFSFSSIQKTGFRGATDPNVLFDPNFKKDDVIVNEVANDNHIIMLQKLHDTDTSEGSAHQSDLTITSQYISAMAFENRSPQESLNVNHGTALLTNIGVIDLYVEILNTLKELKADALTLPSDVMPSGKHRVVDLNYSEINFNIIAALSEELSNYKNQNLKKELFTRIARKWMEDAIIEERDSDVYKKILKNKDVDLSFMSGVVRKKGNSVVRTKIYKKLAQIKLPGVIAVTSPIDAVSDILDTSVGRLSREEAIKHLLYSKDLDDMVHTEISNSAEEFINLINRSRKELDYVRINYNDEKGKRKSAMMRGGDFRAKYAAGEFKGTIRNILHVEYKRRDTKIKLEYSDVKNLVTAPAVGKTKTILADGTLAKKLMAANPGLYSDIDLPGKIKIINIDELSGEELHGAEENVIYVSDTSKEAVQAYDNFLGGKKLVFIEKITELDSYISEEEEELEYKVNMLDNLIYIKTSGKLTAEGLTENQKALYSDYITDYFTDELSGSGVYKLITPDNVTLYETNDMEEMIMLAGGYILNDINSTFSIETDGGERTIFHNRSFGTDNMSSLAKKYKVLRKESDYIKGKNEIADNEYVINRLTGQIDKAFYARAKYGNLSMYDLYTKQDSDLKWQHLKLFKEHKVIGNILDVATIKDKYGVSISEEDAMIKSDTPIESFGFGEPSRVKVTGRITSNGKYDAIVLDSRERPVLILSKAEGLSDKDIIQEVRAVSKNPNTILPQGLTYTELDDAIFSRGGAIMADNSVVYRDKDAYEPIESMKEYQDYYIANRDIDLYRSKLTPEQATMLSNKTQIHKHIKELLGEFRLVTEERNIKMEVSEVYANNFNMEAMDMTEDDSIEDVIGTSKIHAEQVAAGTMFFKNRMGKRHYIKHDKLTMNNLKNKYLYYKRKTLSENVEWKKDVYKRILETIGITANNVDSITEKQLKQINKTISDIIKVENKVATEAIAKGRTEAFIKSLVIMPPRIPGQGKQAGYVAKIKGFIHSNKNALYSPREAYLNTGKDNDIDTDNILTRAIDSNGLEYKYDKYIFKNAEGKDIIKDDNDENPIFRKELIEFESNLRKDLAEMNAQAEQLGLTVMSESDINSLVAKKISQKIKDFKSAVKNFIIDEMHGIMTDKRNAIEIEMPITMETLENTADAKIKAQENSPEYVPDLEGVNPQDGSWVYRLEHTNMEGKTGISDYANTQRIYSAIITVRNEVGRPLRLGSANGKNHHSKLVEKNLKNLIFAEKSVDEKGKVTYSLPPGTGFALYIPTNDGKYDVILRDTFANLDDISEADKKTERARDMIRDSLSKDQAWEIMSQLLSAATDNAKVLLLSKINANNDTNPLIGTLLTMGFTFDQIYEFLTSKQVSDILNKFIDAKGKGESDSLIGFLYDNYSKGGNVAAENLKEILGVGFSMQAFRRVLTLTQKNKIDGIELHKVLAPVYKFHPDVDILKLLQNYKKELAKGVDTTYDESAKMPFNPMFYIINHPVARSLLRVTHLTTDVIDAISDIDNIITERVRKFPKNRITEEGSKDMDEFLNEAMIEQVLTGVSNNNKPIKTALIFNEGVTTYDLSNDHHRDQFVSNIHKTLKYLKLHLPDNILIKDLEEDISRKDANKKVITIPFLGDANAFKLTAYKTALEELSVLDEKMYSSKVVHAAKLFKHSLFWYSIIKDKGKEGRNTLTSLFPKEYAKFTEDTINVGFKENNIVRKIMTDKKYEVARILFLPKETKAQPMYRASRIPEELRDQVQEAMEDARAFAREQGDAGMMEPDSIIDDISEEFKKGKRSILQRALDSTLFSDVNTIDKVGRLDHYALRNNLYTTLNMAGENAHLNSIPIQLRRVYTSDSISFNTNNMEQLAFEHVHQDIRKFLKASGRTFGMRAYINKGSYGDVLGFDSRTKMYLVYHKGKLIFKSDKALERLNPDKVFFGHDFRQANFNEMVDGYDRSWGLSPYTEISDFDFGSKTNISKDILIDPDGKIALKKKSGAIITKVNDKNINKLFEFIDNVDSYITDGGITGKIKSVRNIIRSVVDNTIAEKSASIYGNSKDVSKALIEIELKDIFINKGIRINSMFIYRGTDASLVSPDNEGITKTSEEIIAEVYDSIVRKYPNLNTDKLNQYITDVLLSRDITSLGNVNIYTLNKADMKKILKGTLDNNILNYLTSLNLDEMKLIKNRYC